MHNLSEERSLPGAAEWSRYIDAIRSSTAEMTEKDAASKISEAFDDCVRKRTKGKFGILFSGGIDSTYIAFICKRYSRDFCCYTVGMEGSKDIAWSRRIAKCLGLVHRIDVLTLKDMEQLFQETASMLKDSLNIVNLGVGAVEVAAARLAKKDDIDVLMGGLGSEEIFAGYQRHEQAEDINEECWKGLKSMWKRDLIREFRIAEHESISLRTPFLDPGMIRTAMSVPGDLKIKNGFKKFILRKSAEQAGLRKEYAFRKKIAAQYGSSFDKAIKKIAKSKGYRYKKQYLNYLSKHKQDNDHEQ